MEGSWSRAKRGEKIGAGPINVISSVKEIEKFKKGEVLVTQMTDPTGSPS